MKLYKLLVVNVLTWGIPAIPSYFTYEISQPFVKNVSDFEGQIFGIVCIYFMVLVVNYMIFWENYYDKYLKFDDESKPDKSKEKSNKEKLL